MTALLVHTSLGMKHILVHCYLFARPSINIFQFCSPAHVMPLLEIVRTQHTSHQVVVDLLDVGKKIKKTPIVVGNCTGFAVNRMFFPYTQSALLFVDYGMDVYKIDRACTKFGMPMGPFRSDSRIIYYYFPFHKLLQHC
jgi:3-hydroxyacyl-CoA dehydrogenase